MVEQKQIPVDRIVGRPVPRLAGPVAALTPKEVLAMLRCHVFLIICMTVMGLLVGGVTWYFLKRYYPEYTAKTYIRVLPPTQRDPMTVEAHAVAKDIQYGYRVSMASLIKQQSMLDELVRRDKIQETKWFKSFGKIKDKSIVEAIIDLKEHLGVIPVREGDFIEILMTCADKEESSIIVNEMVDLFLGSRGTTAREEVADKLTKFEEQRVRVQRDLDAAEKALDDVRSRWGLTDLEETRFQHTIAIRLNDLELEQNELMLEIKGVQAIIDSLSKRATGPINEQVENQVERDPIMVSLAQQLVLQEAQLASILTRFGENHRVVRQQQELINEIREKRRLRKAEIADQTRMSNLENAQDDLAVLARRMEELTRMRDEAEAKKRDLDLAKVQYAQRVTIKDERKEMLNLIKSQVEKLKMVYDDPETPKVQFVGRAPIPLEISSPKWEVYFPSGTIFGFMLGVGIALLMELLNDLVRTPVDVSKHLHIPLLGIIPDSNEDEQLENIDLCHAVCRAPFSITSESYRRFRTNLKLSNSAESLKVLLITSAVAGDGKTSVAANLAVTFVAENKKVLLIDANFRRPALHTVFPKKAAENETTQHRDFSLSDLLMGQCSYQDAINSAGIEGLDVIYSGHLPANAAELLGSDKMKELIKQLRNNYDHVIIDTAPVLLVSDTKVLTGIVDKTILVFNAAATRRGIALRTIRELREVNAEIVGCVLLAAKSTKSGYFREQFRSYQEYHEPQLVHST